MKSYGIILYYVDEHNRKKFLIYQRRDSHAFISLLRNSHKFNRNEILKLSKSLTYDEKQRLSKYSFDELWDDLIINKNCRIYTTEKKRSSSNFYRMVKNGIIDQIVNDTETGDLEWGFPKGRQNPNETDIDTKSIKLFDRKLHIRLNNYLTTFYIGKIDHELPIMYRNIDSIRKSCVSEETNDLKWIYADQRKKYLNNSLSLFVYYIDTNFT